MSLKGNLVPDQILRGRINRLDTLTISAYSIAVKNGFEGTEEEWLESLGATDEQVANAVEAYMAEHPVSGGNVNQGTGWTTEQINLLDQLFNYIPWTASVAGAIADSLIASLRGNNSGDEEPDEPVVPDEPDEPDTPVVTLTSISATYSGGDVAVGTAVSELTGIVVTAHYSDGTSKTVTDYTLSGTIAEGSNIITVSYGGKTTTFAVTGVAESGGETEGEAVEMLTTDKYTTTVNRYSDSSIRDARIVDTNAEYVTDGSRFTWYTDEGETSYSGSMVNRSSIRLYTSAETFDADTEVKVCIEGAPNTYDYFVVGDTEWDGASAPSSNVIYNCQSFGEDKYKANVYHEIVRTVKAGRRLVVASFVNSVPVSIISPDATPVRYTVNIGTSTPILISEDAFEQNTTVKVKISSSENTYSSFWFASSDWDIENNIDNTHFYNVRAEGSQKWEKPVALEADYTVLAGCRLALAMYTGNWSNLTISVTEVV